MPDPAADPEELRRRVYGAGATADDVARYRASLAASVPARSGAEVPAAAAPPPRSPAAPPPASRSRARRALLVVVAAGAVVVAVLAPQPLLRPVPTAPEPDLMPLTAAERAGFVRELRDGFAAGIGDHLQTHPGPPAIRSATFFDTVEGRGTGPGGLGVTPETPRPGAGRATVLIVLDASADVRWRAEGLGTVPGGAVTLHPLRSVLAHQEAGELSTATFRFRDADRPTRLRITVPAGVHWGAAVVLSD